MFREGDYNGVPLYADSTIEPYSVVLVPVGRNLMRPYERIRSGDLAGTTGSRAPSFPGVSERAPREMAIAAGSPSSLPQPTDEVDVLATERAVGTTGRLAEPAARAVGEVTAPRTPPRRGRPFSYDSVSVQFRGEKWVMAGPMTELPSGLVQVAEYKGFPVYAQKGRERALHLSAADARARGAIHAETLELTLSEGDRRAHWHVARVARVVDALEKQP